MTPRAHQGQEVAKASECALLLRKGTTLMTNQMSPTSSRMQLRRMQNVFHSTICKRKPIFELSYQFSDEGQNRLDMVLAEIGRRGWSDYILNAPTKANITWVREFYANFHDRASTQVYLRGKLLPIDVASLAEFIHIYPKPGHAFGDPDAVQTMHNDMGEVDLEAIKNRLCFPGSSWTLGSNMRPRLLKNSTLTLETRAWSRIYLSHIHPVSHISELNVEHAVFLYCIMEGCWIDLSTRLQRAIHMAHHLEPNRHLPFPSLITALASYYGVEDNEDDEWQSTTSSVTAAGLSIKNTAAQNRATQQPNPLDFITTHLTQMEVNMRSYMDQKFLESRAYIDQRFTEAQRDLKSYIDQRLAGASSSTSRGQAPIADPDDDAAEAEEGDDDDAEEEGDDDDDAEEESDADSPAED